MKEITFADCLISDLQSLPKDKKELDTIDNPLRYEWKRRSIADRERLLDQLDIQERTIIERMIINRENAAALTDDTGLTVKQLHIVKNDALDKLLRLRHGAAYRP